MGIRREEEMEMSDDENCDSPAKKMRVDESGKADKYHLPGAGIMIFHALGWGACMVGNGCITHFYLIDSNFHL